MTTVSSSKFQVASISSCNLLLVTCYPGLVTDGIEARTPGFREARELVAVLRGDPVGACELVGQRIAVRAVDQEFVMQVRAAREAGGADIGDGLALIHEAADVQAVAKTREMRVQGAVGGVVADDDALAVAAVPADGQDAPAGGGAHRRSGGRAVVHALVRAPLLEHGVIAAGGEARGDARELHGRAQEGPAHAGAIGRVIGGVTVGVAEGDGAEGTPLVDELGREDGSVRYLLPLPEFFLVHHGEAVTAAQV